MKNKLFLLFFNIIYLSALNTNEAEINQYILKTLNTNYKNIEISIQNYKKNFNENWNILIENDKKNHKNCLKRERTEVINFKTEQRQIKKTKIEEEKLNGFDVQILNYEEIQKTKYIKNLQIFKLIIEQKSKINKDTILLDFIDKINKLEELNNNNDNDNNIDETFIEENYFEYLNKKLIKINNKIINLIEENNIIQNLLHCYDNNIKTFTSPNKKNLIHEAIEHHISNEISKDNTLDNTDNKKVSKKYFNSGFNQNCNINQILLVDCSCYFNELKIRSGIIQNSIQNYSKIAQRILDESYNMIKDYINNLDKTEDTIISLIKITKKIKKLEEQANINETLTRRLNDYNEKINRPFDLIVNNLLLGLTKSLEDILPINETLDQKDLKLLIDISNNFYNQQKNKIKLLHTLNITSPIPSIAKTEELFTKLVVFCNQRIKEIVDVQKNSKLNNQQLIKDREFFFLENLNLTNDYINHLKKEYTDLLTSYKVISDYLIENFITDLNEYVNLNVNSKNIEIVLNSIIKIYQNEIEVIFLLQQISIIKNRQESINKQPLQKDLEKICEEKKSRTITLLKEVIDSQENNMKNFFSNNLVIQFQQEENKINEYIINGINKLNIILNPYDTISSSLILDTSNRLKFTSIKFEEKTSDQELLKLIDEFCKIQKEKIKFFKQTISNQKFFKIFLEKKQKPTPLNTDKCTYYHDLILYILQILDPTEYKRKDELIHLNENHSINFFKQINPTVLQNILPSYRKINILFSNNMEEIINKILNSNCTQILFYTDIKKQYFNTQKNSEQIINELYKNCPMLFIEIIYQNQFNTLKDNIKFPVKNIDDLLNDIFKQIYLSGYQKLLQESFQKLAKIFQKNINNYSDFNVQINHNELFRYYKELYESIKNNFDHVQIFIKELIVIRMNILQNDECFYKLFKLTNEIWHNYEQIPKLSYENIFVQKFLEYLKNCLIIIEKNFIEILIIKVFGINRLNLLSKNFKNLQSFCFFTSEITKLKIEIENIYNTKKDNSEINTIEQNLSNVMNNFNEISESIQKTQKQGFEKKF